LTAEGKAWMLGRFQDGNLAVKTILHPWHLLLMCVAGWLQHEQQHVIEFSSTAESHAAGPKQETHHPHG